MMIARSPTQQLADLDDERQAALERLDADLRECIRAADYRNYDERQLLEQRSLRALRAYDDALCGATGVPDDSRWRMLAETVAAFLALLPHAKGTEALRRLRALVCENLDPLNAYE